LPYTSGFGFHSHCVSGNFVIAQPLGVLNGVDFGFTGKVRQIESLSIKDQLAQNNIVLLSPLGISLTGDVFNCKAEDVAAFAASHLKADKLIIFSDLKNHPELKQEIQLNQLNHLLLENTDTELAQYLRIAKISISKVNRIHLIEREQDGSLLTEMFTRDGSGVMITGASYHELRAAKTSDIQGLLNILQPLEEQGVLVSRSKEQLELDIQYFHVIERDGLVVASVALIPYKKESIAEVACLAVHKDYQKRGYGHNLLVQMENTAKKSHLSQIFVLTTQTTQWFLERDYHEVELNKLPKEKQAALNKKRNSKILIKNI
jgi:amino-acid N-acetyltransferase